MLNRALPLFGLALISTLGTMQAASANSSSGCTSVAMSYDRNMVICNGAPTMNTVSATLRNQPAQRVGLKAVGRTYQIPPWEITGISSAGSNRGSNYGNAAQVVRIQQRNFAVYPRGGTTILVERRR